MLEELLRIKHFREYRAALEVYRWQQVLERRKCEVDNAEARLSEYRQYRIVRERDLFEDIKGRKVHVCHLERMRGVISQLRESEALLHQEIAVAKKALEEAREKWRERRRRHALAAREKEKFVQLVQIHRQEVAMAIEKKEETELEEYSALIRGRR